MFAYGNMIRYDPPLVDLTCNFFVLCTNVKDYLLDRDQDGIKLMILGSAVRLASVARHITDCTTWPCMYKCESLLDMIILRRWS